MIRKKLWWYFQTAWVPMRRRVTQRLVVTDAGWKWLKRKWIKSGDLRKYPEKWSDCQYFVQAWSRCYTATLVIISYQESAKSVYRGEKQNYKVYVIYTAKDYFYTQPILPHTCFCLCLHHDTNYISNWFLIWQEIHIYFVLKLLLCE